MTVTVCRSPWYSRARTVPGLSRLAWSALGLLPQDKAIQKPGVFLIEATEGLFLDVPANEAGHEVFGKGRRRQRSECGAPQQAKLVEAERPYAGDLGLQRLFVIGSHR